MFKTFNRRLVRSALLTAALVTPAFAQAEAKVIKISHQFPTATDEKGDFRDRLVRRFADEVSKRTNGDLSFEIYPGGSLVKASAQISAMRRGALDMSLVPLAYGGGEIPEVNLTLMPTLITSYEQGLRWKDAPIGKELDRILADKNIKIVTWIWQAGGIVSSKAPVVSPDEVKGLKFRGGSRTMDLMLRGSGAAITSMPSSEIYSAMQTGVLDAALTSSTSLISYRLYEFAKNVTSARNKTFWYMFEPLLMSKSLYESLTPEQQKVVMEVGASLEPFGMEESKKDDQRMAAVYAEAGANVSDMDEAAFAKWRAIAEQTAFEDFAENVKNGRALLEMAVAVE